MATLRRIGARRSRGLLDIACVASVIACVLAPRAAFAQACALTRYPSFVGHTLPLDTDPSPQAMSLDPAFPALVFGPLVGIHAPPDGSNRLFVVEKVGRIHVFENRDDVATASLFLDIRTRVQATAYEQGLLGLAFDPDYASNRRFFVNYTATTGCTAPGAAGCTKIVRFEASPANPDQALESTAVEILEFPQPYENHNGGAMAFGPDGLLHVATGDGGSGGDPQRNAQNRSSRLGKILRLDVRPGSPSIVPATNPFVGIPNADPLVHHYGLRNPWRISFDRLTGDLLIADVGQGRREEVDRVRNGSPGGLNFGWDYCEGTLDHRTGARCADIASTPPDLEYEHGSPVGGSVIIGGYVYRGDLFPELYGAYLYADAGSHNIWAWDGQAAANAWNPGNPGVLIAFEPIGISSFGEDRAGEIFAVSSWNGKIYRLARAAGGGTGSAFPGSLSQTGLFFSTAQLIPATGMIEYDVASPLWSDGSSKRRWIALPGEGRIRFHAREAWQFPIGTVFVKHFELPRAGGGTRRVETRVFLRQKERWAGVTYRWNASGTDATLQTSALDETIDLGSGTSQLWHYPSTTECLSCHTAAAGRVLGARTRQLAGNRTYPFGTQSQIDAWNCAKLFDFDVRDKSRYAFARALSDATASRTLRARSYLAANCEHCHQPTGPAPGNLDLRFTRAASQWNAIGVPPSEGDLGIANAQRITPGDASTSILQVRQSTNDPLIRMARGTRAPDPAAVTLLSAWIQSEVAIVDSDADGIRDAIDVCPAVPDPLQRDADLDRVGDRCDADALPDLAVLSISSPSGTILPGQPIALSASVRNLGSGGAASFPVTFYLSTDTLFDPALDTTLGHCWVESLASATTTSCAAIGARLAPSFRPDQPPAQPVYRVLACANEAEVELESNSANDCAAAAQGVAVPEPVPGWPCALLGFVRLARGRRVGRGSVDSPDVATARRMARPA